MCTVVVEVPELPGGSVRLLAVRDEDPTRPWDPPGEWWPIDHPGVIGVHDRRAGGAWLATDPSQARLSVLLNRMPSENSVEPEGGYATRGALALNAVSHIEQADPPLTAAFNFVSVDAGEVTVSSWDGVTHTREVLSPGVHMLAHHDVDDAERTPRIAAWLPKFQELRGTSGDWRSEWARVLSETTHLSAEDDRAILRDNRIHGYPTQSLLACLAEINKSTVRLDTAVLTDPASNEHPPTLIFERTI